MATPSTQKAGFKPIAFALLLNGRPVSGAFFTLIIRPEELTHSEPSRTNVVQTLGAPFLDGFGLGVSSISINGHTGWRGGTTEDGAALFHRLRETIFVQWHALRQLQQQRGQDPDTTVEMVFLDVLDNINVVVAPQNFTLRRNRTRPLLYQYMMSMTVLREADAALTALDAERLTVDTPQLPDTQVDPAAVDALDRTIENRTGLAAQVREAFAPAQRVIADLVTGTQGVLTEVKNATTAGIDAFDAVSAPLVYTARSIESASRNLAQSLVEPLALTETVKRTLRDVYRSHAEAYCNLTNAFQPLGQYLDFADLFGASNCSSTTGGRPETPWAGENPFLSMYEAKESPVVIDADTQGAINEANQDVLTLNTQSLDYKMSLVERIARGLR